MKVITHDQFIIDLKKEISKLKKDISKIYRSKAAKRKANKLNEKGIKCYICDGEKGKFGLGRLEATRDHIIPKSQCIKNCGYNITLWAHYKCNNQKHDMSFDHFLVLRWLKEILVCFNN